MPPSIPNQHTSDLDTVQLTGGINNQVQEDKQVTPTAQNPPNDPPPRPPHSAQMSSSIVIPSPSRQSRTVPSSGRPVSMPPQAYNLNMPGSAAASGTGRSTPVNGTSADRVRAQVDDAASTRRRDANGKSNRSSNRMLGDYMLTKLLGAGSMGKVKLAIHNVTGQKFAVKILPRVHPLPIPHTDGIVPDTYAKQASKDASKEIRTLREAALSLLLHHPYICGMREMIVHQHHYYMVFEYVNGGQMLDFIISHGRLRERVARKFARQIGSALEYCHRNNVVHRDLKIENILISQTGNIKIIDFGLSNLYDPIGHLSTFCGSLYFAAPELLNAKVYTGPEVDVWSFGVVLYVLVCGKVPFDDQSMPALHAKIKRGLVEYPVWLSTECKHILSRMLVTNPAARASLSEVLNHPWMVRGFSGPADPHLLNREPLRADELDKQVIRGMKGFEFGTEEEIERKLVQIIESDSYIRAVQAYERKKFGGNGHVHGRIGESLSNSSIAISLDGSNPNLYKSDGTGTVTKQKSKRFSGFEFYRKKLFSPASSPPGSPLSNSPPTSQSHLSSTTLVDQTREPPDPARGFHPLISMYYLAREKLERERVFGPGHFASSQLSLQDSKQPGDSGSPSSTLTKASMFAKKDPIPAKADYGMQLSRLPAPETSHYSGMSYDVAQASPSPTSPTFQAHAQPRARDAGLPVKPNDIPDTPPVPLLPPNTPTAVETAMPRAPPASTHRRSHSLSQRPTTLRGWGVFFSSGDTGLNGVNTVHRELPRSPGAELGTTEEKKEEESENKVVEKGGQGEKERDQEAGSEKVRERATTPTSPISISISAGASLVRKFGSMLAGKVDDGKKSVGTNRRATVLGGIASRPSRDEKEKAVNGETENEPVKVEEPTDIPKSESPNVTPKTSLTKSQGQTITSAHRRAATVLDTQGRNVRHERRSSTGAALLSSGGTIGRLRRPSTGYNSGKKPLADRLFSRTNEEDEGKEQEVSEPPHTALGHVSNTEPDSHFKEEDERHTSEKDFKPVFLKGLFSVATTSTKTPSAIKADIRRVLDRMQVQYRELKAGFECIHLPSIDIASVQPVVHHQQTSSGGEPRTSLVKKASKLSFGVRRDKGKDREKDDKELPNRPSTAAPVGSQSGSSSFFNVSSNNTIVAEYGEVHLEVNGVTPSASPEDRGTQTPSPTLKPKILPPIPQFSPPLPLPVNAPSSPMATGEVDQEVFENLGHNTLSVRFEINIVKVPWLPLHGIQFRRSGGDGWQYQMLARRVLTELKL